MSKKTILLVINNLKVGGVQSSLLNLIKEIHDQYNLTLVSFCDFDADILPTDVKIFTLHSPFRYLGMAQSELRYRPLQYVARFFWVGVTKLFGRSFAVKIMSLFQKKLGTYDCAISYIHEGPQKNFYGGCNEFVLKKIRAKKKVGWIHCDFELCGANNRNSEKIYRQFDEIVACSEGARQAFLRCMPQFENKCMAIRNCNDYDNIRRLAGEGIPYDKSKFNIVTVARLSEEKGIERALIAINKCVKKGYKIHYHLVGWGDMAEHIQKLTKEYDLMDIVTFYGNQNNPYQYIKNADLFLLTSYHEAAPMVFDEAACLGVPVLATKTISTDEMVVSENSGIVCDNSQAGIENALMKIVADKSVLSSARLELKKKKFDNKKSVDNFCKMVGQISKHEK